MPDESLDDDRGSFQTLRDQVRLATPVHPPADPAADQRRRTASLQRLLSLFTGQDYGDPEDPAGGGGSAAVVRGEQQEDAMLGGLRDADASVESGSPAVSASSGTTPPAIRSLGIHSFDPATAIKGVSSGGTDASPAPMSWDQPLAASGGGFSMPSELPTALPSGAPSRNEPWLADNANNTNSSGEKTSPAYEEIAKPRGEGNDSLASSLEAFNSPVLSTNMELPSTGSALEGNATTGSDASAASQDPAPSALSDDALSTQLAAPVAALPTALPDSQPEAAVAVTGAPTPMESTEADGEASFDDGNSTATSGDGANAAPSGTTGSHDPGALGAGSASGGQGSTPGGSLLLTIPDLPDILTSAVQAGTAGFQSAAREVTATLSASVETAVAQVKDINSRFDQHQMDELMKASQMRAIYRR